MTAAEISEALASRVDALALDILPRGHREGHEWRVGSLAGEIGSSLAVHLSGPKAGIWADFATGESGDALDLVAATLGIDMSEAMAWGRCWLGIEAGEAKVPRRPARAAEPASADPDRWCLPWKSARPIAGTLAETYLGTRGLHFDNSDGRVLRFAARRARKNPDGHLEHLPALLCALSDARTGEQCGLINVYLQRDGRDRVRDRKGKTVTGRARGAVVMLSDFDQPTAGLILCEGAETGIAIFRSELRPIWACGGAGTLATFPLLGGIEALTIAADADLPGQRAAITLAERWRRDGREVSIVAPPAGDWADHQ